MELDLDELLAPITEEDPTGEDLEYDQEFAEMMIAATPKAESQVGDKVKEGAEADYAEVLKIGRSLMERTIDLRVAVCMAEAALAREGFPLFAQIMRYIERALMDHWVYVHPQLDEDDGDATERMNALRGLTKSLGMGGDEPVLKQLRRAPLSESRGMGRFSLRHLAVAKGEIPPPPDMDNPPDLAVFAAAIKDTPEETMSEIRDAIKTALEAVEAINTILDDNAPGEGPDFDPLSDQLRAAQAAIAEALGDTEALEEVGEDGGDDTAAAVGGAPVAGGGGAMGAISNPNDVRRAIDLILEYYARVEPSSPVPLLLTRAKRLVQADFMTIMEDMAQGGLEQVRVVGGIAAPEEEY